MQTSHIRKISFKPDSTGPQKPTHRTTSTPFTGSQVNASIKAAYLTRSSIPSAAQLAVSQPFGKNTKNVSVTTAPTIYSTLLIVIMNRCTYLKNDDYEALWSMDPRVKHLCRKIVELSTVDFSPLQTRDTNWATQQAIPPHRTKMRSALLLHFSGDIAACIRYVGGTLLGLPYHSPTIILPRLKGIVDEATYQHIARILTFGCPAKINAHFSAQQVKEYRTYGNHKTIDSNPTLVAKAMNKEDARENIFTVERMLGLFITNINYTPQGILIKPNKKDRLINDSSFQLTQISIPYNAFTNKKDEPPCTFGPAFITLLIDIYNLRISFPNHELRLGSDDITGAFRLLKFAPEAVSGKAIQVGNNLHFAVAQTFGDTTSPPNWDPFSRATCQIASNLLNMNVDLPTHQTYMNKVKVSPDPEYKSITFTKATKDKFNPGKLTDQNTVSPPNFAMHVDDKIYAAASIDHILRATRASITANNLVLGLPDHTLKPDATDMDKLHETEISYRRNILGKIVNTRTMSVSLPIDKRVAIHTALTTTWGPQRKSFTILEASQLAGTLVNATQCCRWGAFLFIAFMSTLHNTISKHFKHILTSDEYNTLLQEKDQSWISTEANSQDWLDRVATSKFKWFHASVLQVYRSAYVAFWSNSASTPPWWIPLLLTIRRPLLLKLRMHRIQGPIPHYNEK